MLVHRIVWNNGTVDEFPFDRYSLKEIRELRDEITVSTHGAFTAQIDLVEVDE